MTWVIMPPTEVENKLLAELRVTEGHCKISQTQLWQQIAPKAQWLNKLFIPCSYYSPEQYRQLSWKLPLRSDSGIQVPPTL